LTALAGRVGRTLTVFQNRRYDADFRTVRRLIRSGELGDVISYDARWDRQEAGSDDPRQLFVDLGSHQIDQVIALFGRATNPRLELWSRSTFDGIAVGYDLHLDAGAVRCRLTGRTLTPAIGPSLELQGSRGGVVCERSDPFAELVRSGRRPSDEDFWRGAPRPTAVLHAAGRSTRLRCAPNAWGRFYKQLAGVLRNGSIPVVTPEQMRRVVSLMETALSQEG
jgi:scyllo-inositol 2-dehydrogenase (NADP+)